MFPFSFFSPWKKHIHTYMHNRNKRSSLYRITSKVVIFEGGNNRLGPNFHLDDIFTEKFLYFFLSQISDDPRKYFLKLKFDLRISPVVKILILILFYFAKFELFLVGFFFGFCSLYFFFVKIKTKKIYVLATPVTNFRLRYNQIVIHLFFTNWSKEKKGVKFMRKKSKLFRQSVCLSRNSIFSN